MLSFKIIDKISQVHMAQKELHNTASLVSESILTASTDGPDCSDKIKKNCDVNNQGWF